MYDRGMAPAIEISGLVKTFGPTRALDGLDLSVRRGEVHGFLGPNGAGKSTTIRVLLGLLRADGGAARLLGGDPWRDAVALHRRLAYVPGDVNLWPNLTGGEAIDLLGRLRGGLDPRRARSCSSASSSTRRRRPAPTRRATGRRSRSSPPSPSDAELLILDEPTSGLDPLMEAVFQRVRRGAPRGGPHRAAVEPHPRRGRGARATASPSSAPGATVESGTLAELRHLTRTSIVAETEQPPAGLDALPGVHGLARRGRPRALRRRHEPPRRGAAAAHQLGVRSLTSQPADARGAVPAPLRRRARRAAGRRGRAGDGRAAPGPRAAGFAAPRPAAHRRLRRRARAPRRRARPSAPTSLYPTAADRAEVAATRRATTRPARLHGPPRGLDTIGGQVAFQVGALGAVVVGLMSLLLVGRHTRTEEDRGRPELVGAAAVGPPRAARRGARRGRRGRTL